MQNNRLNLIEVTLLLCNLQADGGQDQHLILNKLEEALQSEKQRNEQLRTQLDNLKDSHARLNEKYAMIEKSRKEYVELKTEAQQKKD